MSKTNVLGIGRIPPPLDGQSLLTRRLFEMVASNFKVSIFNTALQVDASAFQKAVHYIKCGRQISSFADSVKPDAVLWTTISPHVVSHYRDRLTILGALANSIPVIAVVHWGDFDRLFTSPLTQKSATHLIERLDKIVFNDELLADKCRPWIPDSKIAIVPNAIASECVCSDEELAHKRKDHPQSPFRILYLSNMIASKGYLDVLRAGRLVKDAGIPMQIDFAGDWHDEPDRFWNLVDELELRDDIVHHGMVTDRTSVKHLHLSSDAFVLPTYYPTEAQPSAIIEAMSAGTPVITCDQGGISQMMSEEAGEGIFVPSQNPSKIAEALISLQQKDSWIQYSTNARKRFLTAFNADVISQQWSKIISETVN